MSAREPTHLYQSLKVRLQMEMGRWGDGEMGRWGDGEMGQILIHGNYPEIT
ncbi:MAG: hypothetical protein F6J90_18255 [Moorea sp. SIOASIH]|uniref:hypothetical protein n=1 Tax=Moorena sp. SIOASIH TaxID=2607817 RepID=UPI0013B804E9|nr:hypothetical protein [Moorena sp. SIOASIH]NEO38165.1 hypothetical protein [Moorena sp. SIOASIH]